MHPETPPPPSYSAHLKGGKKKRRKSQAAELPKKFPHRVKPPTQGEQSLKSEISYALCTNVFEQRVPTAPETNQYTRHKSRHAYISYPYT